jgi:hypothetical protein
MAARWSGRQAPESMPLSSSHGHHERFQLSGHALRSRSTIDLRMGLRGRCRALFKYLITRRGQGSRREKLMEALL